MNSFFAMMSRMKYIDRWALMRNSRQENVSEHSLEVAMIAHALAVIGNACLGKELDPWKAAVFGMYHDATEIITGDMPTPVKYYNPQIKDTYQTMLKLIDEFFSGNWTTDTAVWGVSEGAIGAVHVTHESENPRSERLSDEDIAYLQQVAEDLRTGALDLKEIPTEEEYFAG